MQSLIYYDDEAETRFQAGDQLILTYHGTLMVTRGHAFLMVKIVPGVRSETELPLAPSFDAMHACAMARLISLASGYQIKELDPIGSTNGYRFELVGPKQKPTLRPADRILVNAFARTIMALRWDGSAYLPLDLDDHRLCFSISGSDLNKAYADNLARILAFARERRITIDREPLGTLYSYLLQASQDLADHPSSPPPVV